MNLLEKLLAEVEAAEQPVAAEQLPTPVQPPSPVQLRLRPKEGLTLGQDTFRLLPTQREALQTLQGSRFGGFLCMGVGAGKTYVGFLAADVLGCEATIVFVPPRCHAQSQADYEKLSQHYDLVDTQWVKYSTISTARWSMEAGRLAAWAENHRSVCLVFDEAHYLRHRTSARTKRTISFVQQLVDAGVSVKVVAMSGTLLNGYPQHYGHLTSVSLGDDSFLPHKQSEIRGWDRLLKKAKEGWRPFVSTWLVNSARYAELVGHRMYVSNEEALDAYYQLIRETPGAVLHSSHEVGASLYLTKVEGLDKLPEKVRHAYRQAELGQHPDGYEMADPAQIAATLKMLSLGFYYRLVWGNRKPDYEWLAARNEWARQCRDELATNGRAGYDTPLEVARAVDRGELCSKALRDAWLAWREVKHRDPPANEAVWLDETVMEHVLKVANKEPKIVWYHHKAVCEWLGRHGLQVCFAGDPVEANGTRSVALSLSSHGVGLNLQQFSRHLFTAVSSQSKLWEQAIGRSHRYGQEADEVTVEVLQHTKVLRQSLTKAIEDARYTATVSGSSQKLLLATKLF